MGGGLGELGGRGQNRLGHRARAQWLDQIVALALQTLRDAARPEQRIFGVDLHADFLRLGPVLALSAGQGVQLGGQQFESLGVAPLCIDLEQLGADRHAVRVAAHGFLQDLLGLQVAAVGEIDVGFGDRIDIADGIELAQRVAHRRRGAAGIARIDAWPPLAPKKESGCRRLSRNEVSPLSRLSRLVNL